MSWTALAWRLLAHRPAVALLNLAALALGLAALVFVMVGADQISSRFERDLRGVDLVVGAKGSPLQLILAGVFHLDIPPGNIPASLEAQMAALPMVARVIPLSLGDSFRGHRIVGTRHGLIEQHGASLAAGRLWDGPMQAVLGAAVARDTELAVGGSLVGQHGLGEGGGGHDEHPLAVVGVLAPTGGVIDRLILTDIATVWQVHEKAVALDDDDRRELEAAREVTLLQVSYRTPLAAISLPRWVNARADAQAAVPAIEMARLSRLLGVGSQLIGAFGAVLLALAGLSVFAALYAAVQDRLADLAVLRLAGASRGRLVQVILLQATGLGCVALLLGLALGHGAVALLGRLMAADGGLPLTGAWFTPAEGWAAVAAMVTVWLAALAPALKAYRVPVDHLLAG